MKGKISTAQVLLTGVYRTGSEFLTQLINSFPEVDASMYRVNLLRFIYRRYDPIDNEDNLRKALKDLNERISQRYNLKINADDFIKAIDLSSYSYGKFYDQIMTELYLKDSSAKIWAEKCQLVWRESEDFINMMENGKVILIHRDPRSVLASFKLYTNAPTPHYLGAIFNSLDSMSCGLRNALKYPNQFLNIKYEDLIENESEVMTKIASFLNLKNKCYTLDSSNLKDAYGNPWHVNSSFHSNDDKSEYNKSGSTERWKSTLSFDEVMLVEKICGKMMVEYDYSKSVHENFNEKVFSLLSHDNLTKSYLNSYLETGQGIQAFPSDPLDSRTWEKS